MVAAIKAKGTRNLRGEMAAEGTTPRQLTDLYLLALAVHRGGRLVTFDQRIAISAVPMAGAQHLVVL